MSFLYELANLEEKPGVSFDNIAQGIVNLIPSTWQYPDITGAQVLLEGFKEFKTDNYQETSWMHRAKIMIKNIPKGTLTVCYLKTKPECYEGSFLREERDLLNALAERLGRIRVSVNS